MFGHSVARRFFSVRYQIDIIVSDRDINTGNVKYLFVL